ncbi:MAG: hypothetical protein D6824_07290 [Planctomycetota bacterium]|nr:MAG: hypothetical protein D6824_07290 [Planctomycetota bacterium]
MACYSNFDSTGSKGGRQGKGRQGGVLRDELAERLRRALASQGDPSGRLFAKQNGFCPETVRRYLKGCSSPSAAFLETVARTLDLNPMWLLLGEGPMQRSEAVAAAVREASDEQIASEFIRRLRRMERSRATPQRQSPSAVEIRAAPPQHNNGEETPLKDLFLNAKRPET